MAESRESLKRKRLAYVRTFCGDFATPHPEAQRVLADLKRFCQVTKPGMVVSPKAGLVDPLATLYQNGLKDAYMRIAGFLGIDEKTLFQENSSESTAVSTTAEQ